MNEPFEREERYVVIKLKDLDSLGREMLPKILSENNIPAIAKDCVVVESDWKCYKQTWQAVQREFEGKEPTVPIKQSTIDAVIERLEDSKTNYRDIISLIVSHEGDGSECLVEVEIIDKLIKELKDK